MEHNKIKTLGYLFLLLSLFVVNPSVGQQIIPRVAYVISTTTNEPKAPPGDINPRESFSFGLGFEWKLKRNYSVQIEADYVSKGHQFYSYRVRDNNPNISVIYESNYKHNYLVVPVVVNKYFGQGKLKPYLFAGGYIGFGLGGDFDGEFGVYNGTFADAYQKYKGHIYYGEDPINGSDNDRYYSSSIDLGFTIGIGLLIFDRVALDVRYDIGKVNVDEGFGDYKNRSLQVGVMVPIKVF